MVRFVTNLKTEKLYLVSNSKKKKKKKNYPGKLSLGKRIINIKLTF